MITVKIPKDRDGRPKQFAFVNFKHEESVPYGLRLLNGIKLYGRPMRIQFRSGTGGTFTTFVGGRELLSAALACSRAIAIREPLTKGSLTCQLCSPHILLSQCFHQGPPVPHGQCNPLAEPSLWVFVGNSCSTSKICSKLSHEPQKSYLIVVK